MLTSGEKETLNKKHVCAGKAVSVRQVLSVEQVFQKKVTGHDRGDNLFLDLLLQFMRCTPICCTPFEKKK